MRIRIRHETVYAYAQPVLLQPQRIRLRPREGPGLAIVRHELRVVPSVRPRWSLDAEGNAVASCWFDATTRSFEVTVDAEVTTTAFDPFDFVLDPKAVALPIETMPHETLSLAPLRARPRPPRGNDAVAALAREVEASSGPSTVAFVAAACRMVNERIRWFRRLRGRARSARITLACRRGACRDTAVLLADVYRSVGLAARIVSGYAVVPIVGVGDDLHAWTEVYLPGAGWRGFDPTRGLAIDERYVPLAASATFDGAAAISGGYIGFGTSTMRARVAIEEVRP